MRRKETYESLARELHRQRQVLFKEVAETETDLRFIAEDRESELEERAQEERAARLYARLGIRAKREIEEIDAALQRLADGKYGACGECGDPFSIARLHALPATRLCIGCARLQEARAPGPRPEVEAVHGAPVPPELGDLTDLEREIALREQIRQDGRVDLEELRVVCRHGVVYFDGAVPSEAEHQILLKLVTDVAGLHEVVDRLRVQEILWDRPDRSKTMRGEKRPSKLEPATTEDVVRSIEEGIEYTPPSAPPPEEEEE